jgi:dihydroorotase
LEDQQASLDLLLKGGYVIDPANGIDGLLDVGISGKEVTHVGTDIPISAATAVVDVSDHIVTPGILDIHTHVYPFVRTEAAYGGGMNADAHLLASGVTTTVDAGTVGWMDFPDFKARYIDRAQVRILAFLNIAAGGMVNAASEQDLNAMQPHVVAALAEAYSDVIVGIKTAHYWTKQPWDAEHPPWASVERAVEAGDLCGRPVMVDFWPRPPERSYPDLILKKLRPGDIHTHVFAQQFPIVDENSRVYDHLIQARERGVIFDLGHGAGSFWFLSKYLSMGMPLQEVIMRSTVTPAREIGRPALGTLSVGSDADIAVFKHLKGTFGFTDCGRARLLGKEKLECAMTLRAGKIVYDPTGLSMPQWEHAPESYRRIHAIHI